MQGSLQNQPQIKVLPAFSVSERFGLREEDIDQVVKTVQGVLPQRVDGDCEVTITLVEKNLKIIKDMALMKEALAHLVRNAMDVMPGCGKVSLTINQVDFGIESLLNSYDFIIGACAFISLAGEDIDVGFDGKIKEKIREPFFTTKIDSNGLGLALAYRILKQHHGRIKVENREEQGTEVNIYLPLTKLDIVNMMSTPAG